MPVSTGADQRGLAQVRKLAKVGREPLANGCLSLIATAAHHDRDCLVDILPGTDLGAELFKAEGVESALDDALNGDYPRSDRERPAVPGDVMASM